MTTKFRGRTKRAARQGKEQMRLSWMDPHASVPMRSALDAVTRMGEAETERRVIQAAREMAELGSQPADSTTFVSSRWGISSQPTMH